MASAWTAPRNLNAFLKTKIMLYIIEIKTSAPAVFKSVLQQKVYEKLEENGIAFQRVDTDEAITMEDCAAIDLALDVEIVKTLFLCNRKKTDFYIFVTKGDKPFSTKDFSHALGIARVSFAPAEMMLSMLGSPVGGATVLSAVTAPANVSIVFDEDVVGMPLFGGNDGTTTCYMKMPMDDVFKYLRSLGKTWQTIKV